MKKLFAIRNNSTGKLVKDEYFQDKMVAKRRRDELNGDTPEQLGKQLQYSVTPGPDHHKSQ